jgi:hypothetical protein
MPASSPEAAQLRAALASYARTKPAASRLQNLICFIIPAWNALASLEGWDPLPLPAFCTTPPPGARRTRKRVSGIKAAPRRALARCAPHVPIAEAIPDTYAALADKLSIFENDVDGDCDTAEEMQAINTAWGYVVPDSDLNPFLETYGLANGANSLDVIALMQETGIDSGGNNYKDGAPTLVDPADFAAMSAAIYAGAPPNGPPSPVKIDVCADQLDPAVDLSLPFSICTGFRRDNQPWRINHDTDVAGYGTTQSLLALLNEKYATSKTLPSGFTGAEPAYIHYTWGQYQLMDAASLANIADQGYLRTPGSIRTPVGA